MTAVEPTVIDVPGATSTIAVTTDGTTVWAATNGAVLRIDAATGVMTTLPAPAESGDTTLAIAADGLWMTRWAGNHLYRLDPATGEVLLAVELAKAVRIAFVGDDLWVGSEATSAMSLVDRQTGAVGRAVNAGAYGTAGLGDLWFNTSGAVQRVDPASGAVKATMTVQDETNCSITGAFPDDVWVSCFGRDVVVRTATRLDPQANAVAATATLPPSHGGSFAILDGEAWFVGTFKDASGSAFGGLLRVDAATGAIEQSFSIGPGDLNVPVVAGSAIWVPDEAGHRILRMAAADLAG